MMLRVVKCRGLSPECGESIRRPAAASFSLFVSGLRVQVRPDQRVTSYIFWISRVFVCIFPLFLVAQSYIFFIFEDFVCIVSSVWFKS